MTNHIKVAAIIVTYNPPGDIIGNISKISDETDFVIVIDNSSREETTNKIENYIKDRKDKISLIKNEQNLGIAAAQNIGIREAEKLNAEWVILFDHDSIPETGMVAKMLSSHEEYIKPKTYNHQSRKPVYEIALIAPNMLDRNIGRTAQFIIPKLKVFFSRITIKNNEIRDDVISVIASGSIIKMAAIRKIGGMKDKMFIDYVDHEFCLRLRESGYGILVAGGAFLEHSVGEKNQHHLSGVTITTSNHSAFRRYYIFRNRVFIWRKYWRKFPSFVIHDFIAAIFDLVRIILLENNKKAKLANIIKGTREGIFTSRKTIPL